MESFIPRKGPLKWLNSNAFVIIMVSAAANSAPEVLMVQRLYYNVTPNAGTSNFLLSSSQLLGYGIGGMMWCMFLLSILGASRRPTSFQGFPTADTTTKRSLIALLVVAVSALWVCQRASWLTACCDTTSRSPNEQVAVRPPIQRWCQTVYE
ncbi:hypothetical protein BDN67DRAFT_763143 [Paxillus ammoniavirescens]|nr:hypothetical protein BDN67DRAFT_763143 [Paxillus ammoniavirescens]